MGSIHYSSRAQKNCVVQRCFYNAGRFRSFYKLIFEFRMDNLFSLINRYSRPAVYFLGPGNSDEPSRKKYRIWIFRTFFLKIPSHNLRATIWSPILFSPIHEQLDNFQTSNVSNGGWFRTMQSIFIFRRGYLSQWYCDTIKSTLLFRDRSNTFYYCYVNFITCWHSLRSGIF